MILHSPMSQEALLQQIVTEAGIVRKDQQQGLKRCFDKKCTQHVNMLQYNQLREDRFALNQQKVLERQNLTMEKSKEYL